MPLFPRAGSGEIEAARGGRLTRVERDGGDVLLVIRGLRRFGLGWATHIRCVGAGTPVGFDERAAGAARPLGPGWDVEAMTFDGVRAVLDVTRSTGPGDRDAVTYSLPCRAVRVVVRPSLRETLKRLASI